MENKKYVSKALQNLVTPQAIAADKNANNVRQNVQNAIAGFAMSTNGGKSDFLNVDLSAGGGAKNNWLQYDIVNGSGANAKVILGSVLGVAGRKALYDVADTLACDVALVADGGGEAVANCQGLSLLAVGRPLIISEIQITSSDSTQLNQEILYKELSFDRTVYPWKINVSATAKKSDQRDDLLIMNNDNWTLDAQRYLEFTSISAKSFTIKLFIDAAATVAQMAPYI